MAENGLPFTIWNATADAKTERSNVYTPRKLCLWWVYCFHVVRVCVRASVCACVRQ